MKRYSLAMLCILVLVLISPTNVTLAKQKELPYTYHNPHIFVKDGYTHIEWRNNTWGTYVVYKYVPTKTPLGINYKRVTIWWKYIAPINIRLNYKEIGYRYLIQRIN